VTLDDYWGQGARSALPIVGDFFQRALRARIVDPRARFDTEVQPSAFETFREKLDAWIETLFGPKPKAAPAAPVKRAPTAPRNVPAPVSGAQASAVPATPARPEASAGSTASAPTTASAPRVTGLPPILGPASAPAAPSPFPAQEPALAPTPTPDDSQSENSGAPAQYTPPLPQQGQ
jgi:penicillin-binding protein 1A